MDQLPERLQRTLGAAYTIERELGGGGMSRVFVATEARLGRRVVVKVLRSEIAAGTSAERFEREMSLCARCHHPHIVPVLSAGEFEGLPWFTMPLVEGESLRDRLAREGAMPVAEAVRLLAEVADGLAYAHRQGVIHRDIKPENILVHDGHAVIADFGVAKALHAAALGPGPAITMTDVGTVIGTPAYMAPEQATGDATADHRMDLYALGVVAFELLTGRHPFDAITPQAMLAAQLTKEAPRVASLRGDCPPALAALIARLLAKDPADRPDSAESVRSGLLAIASGESTAMSRRPGRRVALAIVTPLLVVSVLLIAVARRHGSPTGAPIPPADPPPGARSIAVLPFQNIGGDSATTYFSAGIAEELIGALGRLGGLRVSSRTSSFAARARTDDLKEIGRRLDVGVVLEGTVQQSGKQVRVTARLVDVAKDAPLWNGEYRSEVRDVFAVQDSIARAITGALQVTLSVAQSNALVARSTTDPVAHDLYLQGRYFLAARRPTSVRKAIAAFQGAVARDPSYAEAYAGLAEAWVLGVPFVGFSPSEAYPQARSAGARALALDSTLAEVHTSLGIIAMFVDWNWAEAERRLNRALELNPSYAPGRLFKAWWLLLTGKGESGYAELLRARTLDPLSLIINTRVGSFLHYFGRDREAIPEFERALQIDSTFVWAKLGLAVSLSILGRSRDALAMLPPGDPILGNYEAGEAGVVLARAGRREEAIRELARLEQLRREHYVSADALALIHAALGERDAAFAEMDRAVNERAFTLVSLRIEPMYAPLHDDPRWSRLTALLGFPGAPAR